MMRDTRQFFHDFCSKYFAPGKHKKTSNTASRPTKHYFPNLRFYSSPFADSRILSFKHLLKKSPYNFSAGKFSKHSSGIQNQVVKRWYTKIFGKFSSGLKTYSTQNTAKFHHLTLSKLFLLCPKIIVPKTYSNLYGLKHCLCTPLIFGGLSYYQNSAKLLKDYLNPAQFRHFIKHVRDNPTLYFLGFGIVISVVCLEKVPYSKRRHVVLVPQKPLNWMGDTLFRFREKKSSILPDNHPDSVRVRSIFNKIIEALERDLQIQRRNVSEKISNVNDKEIVKEPRRRRNSYYVKHLERLDWEVIVVKSYSSNAYCLPGGKIVVYTGLLKDLKSDEEIATVIAHEVAHAVARHTADKSTKILIAFLVDIFIFGHNEAQSTTNSGGTGNLVKFFIERPWSRRCEREADYIGLQLMATAGYDPQKAPRVYEMLDGNSGSESKTDFFSSHPSGKKRAKALSNVKVMKEANARYSKAIESRKNKIEDCMA